jgi:putative Holliday junction resolvase
VTVPRRKGVLAIDHGTKRTGFAAVDALRIATTPLEPFAGAADSRALLEHVRALLEERDVDTLLVGWPVHMDGRPGARAAEVERFAAALAKAFPALRVVRYDERLTSKSAEELLRDAGHFGRDARARRDSWSALVLLRDWIASGEPASSAGSGDA